MRKLATNLIMFALLWAVTGVMYPLVITGVGLLVPHLSKGSLIHDDGKIIGSELIGQQFIRKQHFWSRPSANYYDGMQSGGENYGPTSFELEKLTEKRAVNLMIVHRTANREDVPGNLLFASGSGLDPHITYEAAYYQVPRIAKERNLEENEIKQLIEKHVESSYLGHSRVNVLLLNLDLIDLQKGD